MESLTEDRLRDCYEVTGWNEAILTSIIEKKWNSYQPLSSTSINASHYALLYDAVVKRGMPVYQTLEDVLKYLCPCFCIPNKWSNVTRKVQNLLNSGKKIYQPIFLDQNLETSLGPYCDKLLIKESSLNKKNSNSENILTVGAFRELCLYRERKLKSWNDLNIWLTNICPKWGIPVWKLIRMSSKVKISHKKFSKDKLKGKLESFLGTNVISLCHPYNSVKSCDMCTSKCSMSKVQRMKKCVKKLIPELNQIHEINKTITFENDVLHEKIVSDTLYRQRLEKTVLEFENKLYSVKSVRQKNKTLENEIRKKIKLLKSIKSENFYKRLKRREKKLNDKENKTLNSLNKSREEVCSLKETKNQLLDKISILESEKKKKASDVTKILHNKANEIYYLKKNCATSRKKSAELETKLETAKEENIILLKENGNLNSEIEDSKSVPFETKKDSKYSFEVRKCVLNLHSLDIPENKISKVIQTVSENLFDKQMIKLPGRTTIQNIADEGHVLARNQITDQILDCDNFDFFSDGTSRDGKKVLDMGIHLKNKQTLSLGFETVAKENSKTVSDCIKSKFENLANNFSTENNEAANNLKHILTSLSGMMSDRSSVMKKTNELIDEWRTSMLSDIHPSNLKSLNKLYCSAHVLLGFHDVSSKKLKSFQKDVGRIGRELQPEFRFFNNNEPASLRIIRMASEVFGPRGDEKNGKRQEWLAFLNIFEKNSKMINYRANRFNNLFSGAVSLIHHEDDIVTFLTNHVELPNLKLKSVLYDILDENVIVQVLSLAILSMLITEPLWALINSTVHYVDLFKYFTPLKQRIHHWSTDASSMINIDINPIFNDFPHQKDEIIYNKINSILKEDMKLQLIKCLQTLCLGFVEVIDRQLSDNLPGGVYGEEASAELKERMSHSKLTNLPAENLFGDLDSAINRKRNATFRHHSAIIMLKRNKTMSWLKQKSLACQSILLSRAMKSARKLRQEEREKEKTVMLNRKAILIEIKEQKEMKKQKTEELKEKLTQQILGMGGLCKSVEQLNDILESKHTMKSKKELLRTILYYCKNVLGKDIDNTLCVYSKNTVLQMKDYVCTVLNLKSAQKSEIIPGTLVAVAYQDTWYPGEIIKIFEDSLNINFMHKTSNDQFSWPRRADNADVQAKFIIHKNFDILPTPCLRYWTIPNVEEINEEYLNYCKKYF